MRKSFLSLPVLLVLAATGFVYYTTIFIVTEQWMSLRSAPGLLNAIIFTGLTLMLLYCYSLAIFKDPGQVPASHMRDLEDPEVSMHEVKRKGGDLRYCQKCGHYKPPRAHHCRVCKRCVLRMDHHCVWINNCVGHENYKPFFLFVLYVVIACIYALVLLVGCAIKELHADEWQSENIFKTSYILCASLLIPLTLALVVLLVWHVYLLSHNKTTIEYHEGVRAMWLDEKAGRVYHHPYDLGLYPNLVSHGALVRQCVVHSGVLFDEPHPVRCAKCPLRRCTNRGVAGGATLAPRAKGFEGRAPDLFFHPYSCTIAILSKFLLIACDYYKAQLFVSNAYF